MTAEELTPLGAAIEAVMAKLPENERAHLREKLSRVITHRTAIHRFPTPAHLAQHMRPGYLQTPMLDQIDYAVMEAEKGIHRHWIVNTPPQEGKTTRLQDGAAWLLLRNPTLRIAFASYEQSIAAQSGLAIRQMIETHGNGYHGQVDPDRVDVLGLTLDPNRSQVTRWSLSEVPGKKKGKPPGGVISVGISSSLTGRPVDVLIVDDPLKDAKQADSPVFRQAVKDWFQSVANTRMSANGIIIVIQTRWHEDDLTGWLLKTDKKAVHPKWKHINIQAQAGENDILGRKPGQFLPSARGRTVAQWEETKVAVGTRWWFALYQGDPSPPEGGTFKREWFDKHRVAAAPELRYCITVVDPADNDGDGDEAGVMSGGIGPDGDYYLLEDNSGHYTVAGWVRVAIFSLLRNKASRLMYEQSLSGLKKSIQAEWKRLRRQARDLYRAHPQWSTFDADTDEWPEEPNGPAIADVVAMLTDEDDTVKERTALEVALVELWPFVPRVLELPETGPPVKTIIAKGSKQLRAELASPHWETGKVHHVGTKPTLEHQMATWLPTQDSPDRMDTAVHLVTELSKVNGISQVKKATGNMPKKQAPLPRIMRSTRY